MCGSPPCRLVHRNTVCWSGVWTLYYDRFQESTIVPHQSNSPRYPTIEIRRGTPNAISMYCRTPNLALSLPLSVSVSISVSVSVSISLFVSFCLTKKILARQTKHHFVWYYKPGGEKRERYIHVCMHVWIIAYIHSHTRTRIYAHSLTYKQTHINVFTTHTCMREHLSARETKHCWCIHVLLHTHTKVYTHIQRFIHTYKGLWHKHICVYTLLRERPNTTDIYIYLYTHAYIHTYMS